MKLQHQVCTLEQAKRLDQIFGDSIKSCFYWAQVDDTNWHLAQPCNKGLVAIDDGEVYTESENECYPAYTVAELGQMLPQSFNVAGFGETQLLIAKYDKWYVLYVDVATETVPYAKEKSDSLAASMAAMLIFLLEKNLTTVTSMDEIEQRLDANGIYK